MIKKSGSKSSSHTAPVSKPKPASATPSKVENKTPQASVTSGDKATISSEANDKTVKNMPNLNALADSLDSKDSEGKDKADKTDKTDKADKNDKADKTEKSEEKKYPPEVQAKIDSLEDQLKAAEKSGNKEEIERLKKELEELKNPKEKTPENSDANAGDGGAGSNGSTPADNSGSGAGDGGSSPVGDGGSGGSSPAGSGGSGGGNGGGSPVDGGNSGGSAPAGEASQAGPAQEANSEEVKQFLQFAASAYGVNPTLLSEIARRESNFNTGDIANNWDSNAKKGTPSKGMFQFIQPTFASMAPKAKQANPQAWQGVSTNWTDWKAQALTCAWAISTGQGKHWSTYGSALASAGGNPSGNKA